MKHRPPREHIGDHQRDPQVAAELQRNLLGQADKSLLGWLRKGSMVARQHQLVGKMLLADDSADMPVKPGSLPGDPRRLRGIPAIGGRGSVGGAIAGSRPGDSLKGRRGEEVLREIRQRARELDVNGSASFPTAAVDGSSAQADASRADDE